MKSWSELSVQAGVVPKITKAQMGQMHFEKCAIALSKGHENVFDSRIKVTEGRGH